MDGRTQDVAVLALTIWRENRDHGYEGMQSIANVVRNRVTKNSSSAYVECTKSRQFSSMTSPGDPQLGLWPSDTDTNWEQALDIAELTCGGSLADITNGSTLYYNPHAISTNKTFTWLDGTTIPFPETWNPSVVTPQVAVGGHCFFTEA